MIQVGDRAAQRYSGKKFDPTKTTFTTRFPENLSTLLMLFAVSALAFWRDIAAVAESRRLLPFSKSLYIFGIVMPVCLMYLPPRSA